jgi:GMP synthase-like glutamine amidotransferase
MRILVVNNSRKNLPKLRASLSEHDFDMVRYAPGVSLNTEGYDLVILSGGGGEGREANDRRGDGKLWYHDEIEFIKSCTKPIIGICMGFEVITRAYGEKITKLRKDVSGLTPIKATTLGKAYVGADDFSQNEHHEWCVKKAPDGFEVLAESDTGIEIIRHKSKPIFATQFHPEIKGGHLDLAKMLRQPLAQLYSL